MSRGRFVGGNAIATGFARGNVGIGLPELIVIIVAALIILGPDRLPEAARSLGKAVAEVRRTTEPARSAWQELTSEINRVASSATARGNPWEVHPILAKMTPEERERYMAGGEMLSR